MEDTILLLRYNCPDADCDVACLGWPDLHRHVRGAHHRKICDLCSRYKKVFTHEQELFTDAELAKHMKKETTTLVQSIKVDSKDIRFASSVENDFMARMNCTCIVERSTKDASFAIGEEVNHSTTEITAN